MQRPSHSKRKSLLQSPNARDVCHLPMTVYQFEEQAALQSKVPFATKSVSENISPWQSIFVSSSFDKFQSQQHEGIFGHEQLTAAKQLQALDKFETYLSKPSLESVESKLYFDPGKRASREAEYHKHDDRQVDFFHLI